MEDGNGRSGFIGTEDICGVNTELISSGEWWCVYPQNKLIGDCQNILHGM